MAAKAGKTTTAPPAREAAVGEHNLTAADRREATHRLITREHRELDQKIEAIKATMKALNKTRTVLRTRYKQEVGVDLKLLDRALGMTALSRGDLVKDAEDWNWLCEMEGLPKGGQANLFAPVERAAKTEAERDAKAWESEGFRVANSSGPRAGPEGIPPEHLQDFLRGYDLASEKNAWAEAALGKVVDRNTDIGQAGPVPLEPEPDEEESPEGSGEPPEDAEPVPAYIGVGEQAKEAGYSLFEYQDDTWGVEVPGVGELELDAPLLTERDAWIFAEAYLVKTRAQAARAEQTTH